MQYWKRLTCLSYFVCQRSALAVEQIRLTGTGAELSPQDVCRSLDARFPDLVEFPQDVIYEKEQSQYWSARQSELKPACRLTPTTTEEASDIIQHLHYHEINFAISNGGHSTVLAASNLDAGITLDLSSLSSISIAADNATVQIGTGTRWLDVYQFLDPKGFTVAGARAGSVGTGGFLLGGGISISAGKYGWSCDTVESVEVIAANGTVMNVNQTHHSDLFRSLKGGGSNFGIATSFNLRSFCFTSLQAAFMRYEWDQISRLMREVSDFTSKAHEDPAAALDLSIALDHSSNKVQAFLMITRYGDISQSESFQSFFKIPNSHIFVENVTPGQLAGIVDNSNPPGYRQHRCTMTIRNDEGTVLAIAQAFASTFTRGNAPTDDVYRPTSLIQPISRAQLDRTGENESAGNVLGLGNEKAPLLLISFEVRWSQPPMDEVHIQRLNELLARCKAIALERHASHPFIYLNYAAEGQDVFELLREKGQLDQLKAVQTRYDQHHYLVRHLSNPFKLGD